MPYYIGETTKEVKALDADISDPINLYKDLDRIQSGDVYQVCFMARDGFVKPIDMSSDSSLKEMSNKKFLIHIICQDVHVDDKLSKIMFIKDVTFGVLYEQVKASQKLGNMINTLINNKIGQPLETLIKTSKIIEQNQELDSQRPNIVKLRKDISHMSEQSK